MKILMVNKYLYAKGGAETYFLKIGKYFEETGNKVEYFGMYDEKNTVFNSSGQYTSNMDFHNGGFKKFLYPFKIIYSFEAKKKITKIIENFKPDIIHLNNINFQLTPAIIEAAHKKNIPIIQTVHDYQMLCPNHLMFDIKTLKPCELCIDNSKWNCSNRKCIHGSKIKSIIGSIEAILYKNRKTYELIDQYICPSYFLEKMLLRNPIYTNKTLSIHNFIEQSCLNSQPVEKSDYVLYFGRLSEEKGFEMFLNCCKKLSNIKFIIAGTGPMEKMCTGIDNVEFVGFKTGKELKSLIQKALFSVYPSIWYENCPLSVLESESFGTPVVATRMGGIPELIEHMETGILLESISEDNLMNGIKDLYENKPLIAEMSKNCLNKREKMITLVNYCNQLNEIYKSTINKKAGKNEKHKNK